MIRFDEYDVLTFDCYGTLIDWETGLLSSLVGLLSDRSIKMPDEQILELYARFEPQMQQGEFVNYKTVLRRVIQEFGRYLQFIPSSSELDFLSESLKAWKPFPDTVQALKALKSRYRMAVISNIDNDLFLHSARHLEIDFDWVVTAEQVRSYKPSLKNFDYALQTINRPKNRVLHIAQSVYHDIIPSKKMGLSAIWLNRRYNKKGAGATLQATARPDLEVPDLKTLVSMIGLEP